MIPDEPDKRHGSLIAVGLPENWGPALDSTHPQDPLVLSEILACREQLVDLSKPSSSFSVRDIQRLFVRVCMAIEQARVAFSDVSKRHRLLWKEGCLLLEEADRFFFFLLQSSPQRYTRVKNRLCCARAQLLRLFFIWYGIDYIPFPPPLWDKCADVFRSFWSVRAAYKDNTVADRLFMRHFIRSLSVGASALHALTPANLAIVDEFLSRLVPSMCWQYKPGQPCYFYFDPHVPHRGIRNALYSSFSRPEEDALPAVFWGVKGDCSQIIHDLFSANPTSTLADSEKKRLIHFFLLQWNQSPDNRRLHNREPVHFTCSGVFGYEAIQSVIRTDPRAYLKTVDPQAHWSARDMSTSGFGLVVPFPSCRFVAVQGVVALAFPDAVSWRICRIARVLRLEENHARQEAGDSVFVGVELLSAQPAIAFFEAKKGEEKRTGQVVSLPDHDTIKARPAAQHDLFLLSCQFFREDFDSITFSIMNDYYNEIFFQPRVDQILTDALLVRCVRLPDDNKVFLDGIDDWFL